MLSTELIQGRTYRFEVLKDLSNKKFIKVKTDDGIVFSLQKFKFQQDMRVPDFIDCYVKSLTPLSLGQDISVYLNEFYEEGKEYDFVIKSVKNDPETVYELQDKYSFCFKLFNAPEALAKGSKIKCKILKIKGINVSLKYVGTLATKYPLEFFDFSQWLNLLGYYKQQDLFLHLLESYPEFSSALTKYDNDDPAWILEVLQTVSQYITDWLIDCKDNRVLLARTVRRMKLAEKLALFILEESDYLRNCNAEQRSILQSRLSNYVEVFSQYGQAADMILNKTYMEFIDKILNRLKEAGYLYRPSRQFRIMMTILKLRPEMINSRMGELFEALHNWEESNWKSEPFRSALVQQLQIFIEGNSRQINLLPAHDASEDNKAIIRIIVAIAVQSLLATDTDPVDLSINRAMFYRYISYLNTENIIDLLNKGTKCILGTDRPCEFTWSDTEHPTLLILKSSHPSKDTSGDAALVKTYSTSKAIVQLHSNSLHIIAKNANPDTTVIPNNLFDFLNPKISIDEDIKIKGVKKSNDLNSYGELWDDIKWSIFGHDQTTGERIEKTRPYGGEEVKIIIDDFRITATGNERQRLQFHCTIQDDLYYGDGWMPCDSYHMFGWLSYRDIPGNYDGSLKFAQDEDGNPLLFEALVTKRNNELEFSIKNQIEDYLLENLWAGQESVAIVTHFDRLNNAWLCLSELGCTFKVTHDESTAMLSEGNLVRVKYLEPDRSPSLIQFFIGELSDNQEDLPLFLKKSECLENLMKGFGEINPASFPENSEVVEVEEVMSREELLEIIYMLQRCAYSESEYIKAFNYLGLATILCKLAEENTLHSELTTHMELLKLLQDFGKNQKVNREWLETCEMKVKKTPMLERIFTRLKIVADLDINEKAEWLWKLRKNPRNDTERHLASLVLSYNMLPKDMEKFRKDVLKEISTVLNVNSTTPTSKYYGDESQTVEFKSSLVYSTHGGSHPDPREQLFEISHIICGFMNARGGTLYIGVNDSGYENGLDDDIAYRLSHGHKATIDGMIVDLQNYLDRNMPTHSKDHWEIMSDPESKKGVIIVKVAPVETPVELEGIIYVRSSSTTKPRLDKERDEFIKNRSHNYNLLMKLWGVGQTSDGDDSNDEQKESDTQEKKQPNIPKISPKPNPNVNLEMDHSEGSELPNIKKIETGLHRFNVLHSYEPNFSTPSLYAYFMNNHDIRVTPDDSYLDYEPDCRLALAVKEREKGWLILTFDNGSILKLPLDILSDFAPNETRYYSEKNDLSFVNIAGENDYLLTILKASYGAIFYRIDTLQNLPTTNSLSDEGNSLCDNQHKILAQEIVSPDKLSFFDSDSIDKERRFFGVPLPIGDGTLSEKERINELLTLLVVNNE